MATKSKSKTKSGGMAAAKRNKLSEEKFAFPKERKEPLNDAKHVRNAIARFDQVEGVTSSERDAAWRRIMQAAKKFGVEVSGRPDKKPKQGGRAKSDKA
jgi:phage portal protein BeeE